MVGRPQTLWSVDQATFEWNGPKTESLVNDFLHKRAKMCNSDFLDCKLKSQKFNCRFDSISWIYATLWHHKKKRGQVNFLIYAAPYCFTGHGPVPVSRRTTNGWRRRWIWWRHSTTRSLTLSTWMATTCCPTSAETKTNGKWLLSRKNSRNECLKRNKVCSPFALMNYFCIFAMDI